jgi:hypothetical protein
MVGFLSDHSLDRRKRGLKLTGSQESIGLEHASIELCIELALARPAWGFTLLICLLLDHQSS